jgi:hypothetical protein
MSHGKHKKYLLNTFYLPSKNAQLQKKVVGNCGDKFKTNFGTIVRELNNLK